MSNETFTPPLTTVQQAQHEFDLAYVGIIITNNPRTSSIDDFVTNLLTERFQREGITPPKPVSELINDLINQRKRITHSSVIEEELIK